MTPAIVRLPPGANEGGFNHAQRATMWAFTAFEPQYAVVDALTTTHATAVKKVGYQDEVCPDTGRPHRQGYVQFGTGKAFGVVHALLPGVHISPARDQKALVAYCAKEETRAPGAVPLTLAGGYRTADDWMDLLADEYLRLTTPMRFEEEEQRERWARYVAARLDAGAVRRKHLLYEWCTAPLIRAYRGALAFFMQPGPRIAWEADEWRGVLVEKARQRRHDAYMAARDACGCGEADCTACSYTF